MTTVDLIQKVAKAAGIEITTEDPFVVGGPHLFRKSDGSLWNPMLSAVDAKELASKLGIDAAVSSPLMRLNLLDIVVNQLKL